MYSSIRSTVGSFNTASTYYFAPGFAQLSAQATESQTGSVIPTAGTIDRLFVELQTAPGVGKSYTFTLRINGSDTALTCAVSGTDVVGSDTSHSVSVSAGDVITFSVAPSGTPSSSGGSMSCRFSGSTSNESTLLAGSRVTQLSTASTQYLSLGTNLAPNATETNRNAPIPTGGTIKNLYIKLDAAPGVGKSYVFTLRVNGADTALTCTVSDANTTANDTTHSVSVSAGDVVALSSAPSGTPAAARVLTGAVFSATTDGESCILSSFTLTTLSNTATNYGAITGANWNANESLNSGAATPDVLIACVLKKMYVACDTAPGAAKSFTFDMRVNAASPSNDLSVAISGGAATTGNDTTHTVTVADGDEVDYRSVPAGTPTASNYRFGVVMYIAPTTSSAMFAFF